MNPRHERASAAGAAGVSILAAAWIAASHQSEMGQPVAASSSPSLQCQLDPVPGGRVALRLTNAGVPSLVRGTRYAWVTLGTPEATGEIRELQRSLAPGDTETVDVGLLPGASGCHARAFTQER